MGRMRQVASSALPYELQKPIEALQKISVVGGLLGSLAGFVGVVLSAIGSWFADWIFEPGIYASLGLPVGTIVGAYIGAVTGGAASRLLEGLGWEADPTYVERPDGANMLAALFSAVTARREPGRHERWERSGRWWGGIVGGIGAAVLGFVVGL